MFQLRIYTLRTAEALDRYAKIHWSRHIPSLEAFGVATHGIWTARESGQNRLFVLISYQNGSDPAKIEDAYLASSEFAADMAGFDPENLVAVSSVLLDATRSSPIR
jgi:hypothetical protein